MRTLRQCVSRVGVTTVAVLASLLVGGGVSLADDYSVEVIDGAPEADDVASELVGQFADQGYRIKEGGSKTICEIWLAKELELETGFEPTPQRLYPFTPGQLIGLLQFTRRGSDFRDQTISRGWYTLRFALQPVDGNHIGTSPTRDFLVLIAAADDEADRDWSDDELNQVSAEAAGSLHPAMICLQPPVNADQPGVRHLEDRGWWVAHLFGKAIVEGKATQVPLDLVVAGHAAD